VLLCPIHIADQSKYLLQPLKDPLVAVAAADNGVFIPQTLLGSIESLATTRNRGFLRLSLRHGWAKWGERSANVSGDFGRFRPRTTCNKSLRRVEAITNTVVPHLVLLDNMLSAAACYGSQRYFIFQSLFYQLKSPCNTQSSGCVAIPNGCLLPRHNLTRSVLVFIASQCGVSQRSVIDKLRGDCSWDHSCEKQSQADDHNFAVQRSLVANAAKVTYSYRACIPSGILQHTVRSSHGRPGLWKHTTFR